MTTDNFRDEAAEVAKKGRPWEDADDMWDYFQWLSKEGNRKEAERFLKSVMDEMKETQKMVGLLQDKLKQLQLGYNMVALACRDKKQVDPSLTRFV